jgi:hypothetical protein
MKGVLLSSLKAREDGGLVLWFLKVFIELPRVAKAGGGETLLVRAEGS